MKYTLVDHPVKHTFDITAIIAALGTLANLLPLFAAGASFVWMVLRIIETVTGKTIPELLRKEKQ